MEVHRRRKGVARLTLDGRRLGLPHRRTGRAGAGGAAPAAVPARSGRAAEPADRAWAAGARAACRGRPRFRLRRGGAGAGGGAAARGSGARAAPASRGQASGVGFGTRRAARIGGLEHHGDRRRRQRFGRKGGCPPGQQQEQQRQVQEDRGGDHPAATRLRPGQPPGLARPATVPTRMRDFGKEFNQAGHSICGAAPGGVPARDPFFGPSRPKSSITTAWLGHARLAVAVRGCLTCSGR